MIDINLLKLELANNFGNTGQLEIQYSNGKPDFVGYVYKMDDDTLDFTLMKMTTKVGENPYCDIDFNNIKKITIKYQDGSAPKTFE
jgi:hypothetical protein